MFQYPPNSIHVGERGRFGRPKGEKESSRINDNRVEHHFLIWNTPTFYFTIDITHSNNRLGFSTKFVFTPCRTYLDEKYPWKLCIGIGQSVWLADSQRMY